MITCSASPPFKRREAFAPLLFLPHFPNEVAMGSAGVAWNSEVKKLLAILFLSIVSVAAFAAPKSVAGTWQAAVNGTPNPSIKLIFTPKGEFKFVGSGYSSCGTYKVEGDTILLSWTNVDRLPVMPGTMKRTVVLAPDDTFAIDRFTYSRKA